MMFINQLGFCDHLYIYVFALSFRTYHNHLLPFFLLYVPPLAIWLPKFYATAPAHAGAVFYLPNIITTFATTTFRGGFFFGFAVGEHRAADGIRGR